MRSDLPSRKTSVPDRAARASQAKPLEVAWVSGALFRYRIPFLEELATREDLAVTMFCGSPQGVPGVLSPGDPVPVPVVWISERSFPVLGRRVIWQTGLRALLFGNFDVIVCQEAIYNLSTWVIVLTRRLFGKRLLLYGFGYRPFGSSTGPPRIVRETFRRLLLRSSDAIATYTERGRRSCIEAGIDGAKVFTTMNTIDTTRLLRLTDTLPREEVEALRRSLGLESGFVLLQVGRLQEKNRIDVAIGAVRSLIEQGRRCHLLLVGDGPALGSLEEAARGLTTVQFLGPIYDENRLARLFALADAFIRPARIGLPCVHAFAHRVPVLTTSDQAAGQTPEYEYVIHRRNALVVPSLDPGAYAHAVRRLMDDPRLHATLRKGAEQTARSLSIEHMAGQFAAAVRFAATGPPNG